MKYIKTVAMSLLLANSFSSNEVTWKEIETEIKPHIKEVESDFSALTKNISEIYKQYRETTKTATDFDDFGDYFTEKEKEGKKVRDENALKVRREQNKEITQDIKIKKEDKKKQEKDARKEFITEIKNNITDFLSNDEEITIDGEEITSNKEILQGIDKILNIIKKTYSIITNFNNLKTFSDIDEFTKNYNELINFLKKYQKKDKKDKLDLGEFTTDIFFYTLIFSAIKENKAEILEFFGFPKNIITEIKEKRKTELKDTVTTNIAHTFDKYILNLNTILYLDQATLDEFIAKNKITSEYLFKEENLAKETYNKKVFKNKSLNNMTIFEALSSAKNKEIVKTESPTILAILEKFKGTEEENKKMTVRRAINIIIDFTELSFLGQTEINTTKIREAKKEKAEIGFEEKKNKRIEKLQKEIEKLTQEGETLKKTIKEKDHKKIEEINKLFDKLKEYKGGEEIKNSLEEIYAKNQKEKIMVAELENFISSIENQEIKATVTKINTTSKEIFPKIKDVKIIENKIAKLKEQVNKINSETYKEQKYNDEATNNKEKSPAKRVQARTTSAKEKIGARDAKQKWKKEKEKLKKFNKIVSVIAEKDKNNKPEELQKSKAKDDLDISSSPSKTILKVKKRFNEV